MGGNDPTPVLKSPQETEMRNHVMKVLMEKGQEMKPIVSRTMPSYIDMLFEAAANAIELIIRKH